MKKPITLRVIFILNVLMATLPFIFYYVFTTKYIQVGDLDPMWMIYTGIAYILSFAVLVGSILKKNLLLLRSVIALNFIIALPAKAYLGILVGIISISLSFTSKIKQYFQ